MTPDEFQKELDELKMTYLTMDEVKKELKKPYSAIGVEIDIDTEVDYSKIVEVDMTLKLQTCRKDILYLVFDRYNAETKTLTMILGQPIDPKYLNFLKDVSEKIGTTFPDLCWYYSEGTTSTNQIEVETKFREKNSHAGDISWVLPTRFIDNIIETINLINQSPKFFNGLLRDAIIYGPYF